MQGLEFFSNVIARKIHCIIDSGHIFDWVKQIVQSIRFYLMAIPSIELVAALRATALRLRNGAHYSWGNHGACNCGNLLQVITPLTEAEILRYAHMGTGEWSELAEEYCSGTGAPIGLMISKLQDAGLTPTDIHHIEYLTNKEVLSHLPGGFRWLKRNSRDDVILYFETFARLLESKLGNNLAEWLPIDIDFLVKPFSVQRQTPPATIEC